MNAAFKLRRSAIGIRQQGGAALVVGLVLLMILTLLAISGMNTSTLELQMAGNFQFSQNAFQAAEIGLQRAMSANKFATNVAISTPKTLITGLCDRHAGHVRKQDHVRLREERRNRAAAAAGRPRVQHRREHGLLRLPLRSREHRALAARCTGHEHPGLLPRETGRRLPRLLSRAGTTLPRINSVWSKRMMRTAKPLVAAIAATLTLWCAGTPLADDTEIFEASPVNGTAARPNILLIIDTSGSMVDNTVTQAMDYDPVTSYSGSCTKDRIYWKQGNNSFNCRDQSDQYIGANALVCSAASAQVATIGSYVVANTAQWRAGSNKRWEQLRTNQHSSSNPVECEADGPLAHGLIADDRKLPANGSSGPFTTNSAQAVSLAGQNTYTFYSGNYLNYLANVGNDNQVTLTRLAVVQSVARKFLDSLSGVNVGLMRFQKTRIRTTAAAQGGFVIHEFAPIETARDDLKKLITDLNGNSFTPLSETLYEAYRYWRGGTPTYGNNSTAGQYSYSVGRCARLCRRRLQEPADQFVLSSNFNRVPDGRRSDAGQGCRLEDRRPHRHGRHRRHREQVLQ